MSHNHPYKCNDCGHRWRDVEFKEGIVRCVWCGSKNIESNAARDVWLFLIECSISSIIFGSIITFLYFEYLLTFTIPLWWVIPAGFVVSFFVPIFWLSFDKWSIFFALKKKVWIVLIISGILSITIGSVLSVLYYEYLYTLDVGLWWVIPVGFVVGFFGPIICYFFAEWNHYLDEYS
ncbi:MAG: hypothetical protein ACFE94_05755 [Candidatus Hodarchaeota archaeon]